MISFVDFYEIVVEKKYIKLNEIKQTKKKTLWQIKDTSGKI